MKNSLLLKLGMIFGIVALDQWTKVLARLYIRDHAPTVYLDGLFIFSYHENSGAFLSMGNQLSESTRFWVFVVAISIFVVGSLYALISGKISRPQTAYPYCLIVGGGIGNLIDRVMNANQGVSDFMIMRVGSVGTGVFNVADMAITLGVILLLFSSAKNEKDTALK